MRNVENTSGATDGVVLTDLGAVLHRHIPSAEIDDTGAQLAMQVI
jgi:hypothetical protein